jgi:predicted nucleotidyltransferase
MSTVSETARKMAAVIVNATHPRRVILFGSRARGDATEESDFDLMVVEDRPEDRLGEMVRLRRLLRGFHVPVDLLVVSESKYEYWRDTPGNVYHEAATDGVTLYEAA